MPVVYFAVIVVCQFHLSHCIALSQIALYIASSDSLAGGGAVPPPVKRFEGMPEKRKGR